MQRSTKNVHMMGWRDSEGGWEGFEKHAGMVMMIIPEEAVLMPK